MMQNLKNDWNLGIWVLIWEYSARTFQWIPTWQRLDGNLCVLVLWTKVASASEGLLMLNLPCWNGLPPSVHHYTGLDFLGGWAVTPDHFLGWAIETKCVITRWATSHFINCIWVQLDISVQLRLCNDFEHKYFCSYSPWTDFLMNWIAQQYVLLPDLGVPKSTKKFQSAFFFVGSPEVQSRSNSLRGEIRKSVIWLFAWFIFLQW